MDSGWWGTRPLEGTLGHLRALVTLQLSWGNWSPEAEGPTADVGVVPRVPRREAKERARATEHPPTGSWGSPEQLPAQDKLSDPTVPLGCPLRGPGRVPSLSLSLSPSSLQRSRSGRRLSAPELGSRGRAALGRGICGRWATSSGLENLKCGYRGSQKHL